MFTETITHPNAILATGTSTEEHALSLLRRAVRRRFRIEATPQGGAVVIRDVWLGDPFPRPLMVTLTPVALVKPITVAVRLDLEAIAHGHAYRVDEAQAPFLDRVGRVRTSGICTVPPGAAGRLLAAGLIVLGEPYRATSNGFLEETRAPVRVSLTARLAMLSADHRTSTTAPAAWVSPWESGAVSAGLNKPGRWAGLLRDGSSRAVCSCGELSAWAETRVSARHLAREHRESGAAGFVSGLV